MTSFACGSATFRFSGDQLLTVARPTHCRRKGSHVHPASLMKRSFYVGFGLGYSSAVESCRLLCALFSSIYPVGS